MDELTELRELLEAGRMADALLLVDELDEMSREDKINKISSYMRILLIHLIKQQAEARSMRSWEVSIKEAVSQIQRTNKRRKAGGVYLRPSELREELEAVYELALERAALEAFGGSYESEEVAARISHQEIIERGMVLVVGEGSYRS